MRSEHQTAPAHDQRLRPAYDLAELKSVLMTKSVLLVEDIPLARNTAVRMLTILGFQVTATASADEAMVLLGNGQSFDLIFTDTMMPGTLNGIELANLVVQQHPATKVLITSGYPGLNATVVHDHGIAFITKPYRMADLAEAARTLLNL